MADLKIGRREADIVLTPLDQKQEDRIKSLEEGQEEILKLLRPIAETYATVSALGKWGMAGLVFLSVLIGIILGAKNLFK